MAVLNLLHSVKQYFRWNVIILLSLTCLAYLTHVRIIEVLLSFVALTLAYIFCGSQIYQIEYDFNFSTALFDEDTERAYKYVTAHYLIFAGGFWIGYYLILFFLNLHTFLAILVGNTAGTDKLIILVGLISFGVQILALYLFARRRRLDQHQSG